MHPIIKNISGIGGNKDNAIYENIYDKELSLYYTLDQMLGYVLLASAMLKLSVKLYKQELLMTEDFSSTNFNYFEAGKPKTA